MVEPLTKNPFVIGSGPDRLVRVLAANQKGDGFHALTFSETEVQGVAEIDPDHSALVLRSGAEIPVALPYEELEQKIYSPSFRTDDPVLDLSKVTGRAAKVKPGDEMPDGTSFAGVSPDTHKPMYVMAKLYEDILAPETTTYSFDEAQAKAKKLDAHHHQDWRVPTRGELKELFNNRAALGRFSDKYFSDYWSSSSDGQLSTGEGIGWARSAKAGDHDFRSGKYNRLCVRFVR